MSFETLSSLKKKGLRLGFDSKMVRGEGFEPSTTALPGEKGLVNELEEYLRVNKNRSDKTVYNHKKNAKRILEVSENWPPTEKDLRKFLKKYDTGNKRTYENRIKSVRVITKFLGIEEVGKRFDYPKIPYQPKKIHSDKQIRKMYHALEKQEDKAFYLTLASSGLRFGEAAALKVEDVNFETGEVTPTSRSAEKKTNTTFVNREAIEHLEKIKPKEGEIFNQYKSKTYYRWEKAREKLEFHITPKDLRRWFADKMGRLGVSDRYIDAFCGRVPSSILERHYSDFSPSKLKEIYEEANLKVLD